MNRAHALAVSTALAIAGAACDSTRPIGNAGTASAADCTRCHGDPNRAETVPLVQAAPPTTARSGGDAGAHTAHLHASPFRAAVTCDTCHVVPTDTSHIDGVAAVTFPSLARPDGLTPRWDPKTGTCSGVYCHGAGVQGGPPSSPPWTSGVGLTCKSCHGAPPASHSSSSTNCNTCHPGTVNPDGTIAVGNGLHMNGRVDGGGGHPQGWADKTQHGYTVNRAGLQSCKGCHGQDLTGGTGPACASCHGPAGFPNWDTTCTFCHGNRTTGRQSPPVDTQGRTATSNVSVGAHDAHLDTKLTATPIACGACHPARAASVIGDTSHIDGDGIAEVAFGALAGTGVTPSWNRTNATCAVYCHGPTLLGGPAASPAWTSTATLTCSSCHGNPPSSHDPSSTSCNTCHPGTVAADGTIVPNGFHLNGQKEAVGHPAGWRDRTQHGYSANASGLASCKSCHGATLTGSGTAPSCASCHGTGWDTSCTFCHGNRTTGRQSPPVDTQGRTATSNVTVGAHDAHLDSTIAASPITCAVCHPSRATSVITDPSHIDGTAGADVVFSGVATGGGSPSWNRTTPTCAVYCHGPTLSGGPTASPAWTSTASLTCTGCHGAPPPNHLPSSTNCNTCHPNTVDANGAIVPGGLHMNGSIDSTSPHPSGWGDKTQHGYTANRSGLASCKSCHGTTLAGGTGRACSSCHDATVPSWDTSCTFCHGDRASGRRSPPVDTQGGTATANVSVGVHDAHVGTTLATSIACTQCHPARTSSVITDTAHIDGNGIAEVVLGSLATTGGAGATYTRSSATSASCSSVYCHGTFTGGVNSGAGATMSWTSTTPVTCASCHPSQPQTRRHGTHSGYDCAECHGHSGSGPTHVNGSKDVPFSSSAPGAVWNGTSCGTFSCHGEGHTPSGNTW